MPPSWITSLSLVQNGEAVAAATPNRPIMQLGERTEYLKALVDVLSAGGSIMDMDAPMAPDVQEGQAVYWNATTLQYDRALAALAYDGAGNYGGNADSAYALGICGAKTTATNGVVIFAGTADGVDFTYGLETGETLGAGPYFLSATEPGRMTQNRPVVGVYVMFGTTGGSAVIAPSTREILEDHTHYRYELLYGNDVSTTAGWSNVFDSTLAPSGARYRYTIEADARPYAMFPFQPASSTYFEIDGIGGNDKVTIDNNGIWWTTADREPNEYNTMTIYYAKPTTGDVTTLVRSLQAASDSPLLRVTDCNGAAATKGDLYVHLDLLEAASGNATSGYIVMKSLDSDGKILRGPVVESITSASPEISVSIDSENGEVLEDGSKVGKLTLTYNSPDTVTREIVPTLTELYGALQSDYNNIPYVALPSRSFDTALSLQYDVSFTGLTGTFASTFNAWIYSSSAGALSSTAIQVDYTIIRAAVSTEAYALTDVTKVLTGTGYLTMLPNFTMNANGYRKATFSISGVSVQPGDRVAVKLTRKDAGSYAGEIGILRSWLSIEQE